MARKPEVVPPSERTRVLTTGSDERTVVRPPQARGIDDPAILSEITDTLKGAGYAKA